MQNKKTLSNILLGITAIIWGMAFIFQRVGMDSIEPITFNAARMTSAAVFVSIIAIILDKNRTKDNTKNVQEKRKIVKKTVIGGVCCGIFLAAASTVQQIGIVYTTAGKAGFITAMYMLFVPIINLMLFKKKCSARVWIAVLVGIVGMYLLCVNDGLAFANGDLLILLCSLLFSGHILCCDHFSTYCNPIKLSALQFITAAIISSIIALITEEPSIEKSVSAAIPILYCGIVSGGIGYTLQITAQKYADPTTASLIMSLESVFAVIAGALFIGEKMSVQELFGCIVMFAAIILVQLPASTKKSSS